MLIVVATSPPPGKLFSTPPSHAARQRFPLRPSCLKDFLSRPDLLLERAEFCRFQGLLRTLWVWRLMNYLSCFSADRGKRGSRGSRVSRRWRFPGRSGGVLLEGGSLSRLSFPFLSEAGGRPFRVANFHARGARHSPQESATADEPSGACPSGIRNCG